MTKTATEIGVQFDSLADVLTFGIAPIALLYSWAIGASFNEHSSEHALGVFLLFMYLMCGAFRLARFNLQATRPRVLQEGTPKVDKKNFVGLADTAGRRADGVVGPLLSNASEFPRRGIRTLLHVSSNDLIAVLGILMVSTLRYSSMKTVGTGRRNLYLVLVIAAIGMLMWLLFAIRPAYSIRRLRFAWDPVVHTQFVPVARLANKRRSRYRDHPESKLNFTGGCSASGPSL
jgi:CDP-diacylglycerol--serine O-phosphatidyltransferase